MKAFTTLGDGIAALRRVERLTPMPGRGEILVKLLAAAINYRDLLVVNGVGGWKPTGPRVPLSDGVGIVIAVGEAVPRFRLGDRVAGIFHPNWADGECAPEKLIGALGGSAADGMLTEYRLLDEKAAVAVPDYLTDLEAATLPNSAVTAWHAVSRCQMRSGDLVLIQGTGGVSVFAMQFAHALGARSIVISSSDEKLETVRALGASDTINYKTVPDWEEEVVARTDGRGVDHVIEVVGGANLNRSLRAVRMSGTIALVGLLGGMNAPIETQRIAAKNVSIHGIETGSRAMFEEMNRFLSERQLRPILDRVLAFDQFPEALAYLESGKHFGKVVLAF